MSAGDGGANRRAAGRIWLRWSWRDFRHQWTAIVAIALVMAIGAGVFAGLGSTSTWRRMSNDASFADLGMHDLRVSLTPGTFVDEGTLSSAVAGIADAADVSASAERLVVASQIEIEAGGEPVLVEARIVGTTLGRSSGPTGVDEVWVRDGSAPAEGSSAGVLEAKFADFWDLPAEGAVTVGGNRAVAYSGLGMSPEDFFYEGPAGSVFSQGELAPLYVPLGAAQDLVGRDGQVNDLVVRLAEGSDRDRVEAQLEAAVAAAGAGAIVTTRDEATAVRVLYEDIDNDQRFWNMLAGLVLLAAALAAFNLVSRIVEAQRREIGIGMAIGVARWKLAIRPLLVGAQVGLLGTATGVGVGLLVGQAMKDLLESFLPLPIYRTPFQVSVFSRAALLALLLPVVASAVPVWRAVRVEPIVAIRTGHLAARTSRFANAFGHVRLPGSSLTQMPIRNVLRNPRRTALTAVGVGAAIAALVGVFALLDSFGRTIDRTGDELTKGDPDRVVVQLDTFHALDSDVLASISQARAIGATDATLRFPAIALAHADDGGSSGGDLELLVELVDLDDGLWAPTIMPSPEQPDSGVILARKAADDLGVDVGDRVALRHPARANDGGFALVESDFVVSGIHAIPLRAFAYLDVAHASRFGLEGSANVVSVLPAAGADANDVQHAVFGLDGVTSSQPVARIAEAFDEALAQFVGILVIVAVAVLVLALLIAFNSTRISVDERRREHATMRAFGLPVRSVMGVVIKEGLLVGLLATMVGLAAGFLFLRIMLRSLATTTLPDLQIDTHVSSTTIGTAFVVGIVAVAVAPLFLVRRVRRMDIPDTLRVME